MSVLAKHKKPPVKPQKVEKRKKDTLPGNTTSDARSGTKPVVDAGPKTSAVTSHTNGGHGEYMRFLRATLQLALPLAIIFGAVAIYQSLKSSAPEPRKRPKIERSFAVKIVVAQPGSYQPMLQLFGATTAGRKVDIRALVAGKVMTTGPSLREGGEVAKNTMLLAIDPFDYKAALLETQAQLTEAKARLKEQKASLALEQSSLKFALQRLELSRKDLDRALPLARRGTVSKRTVDDRRNIVLQREQTVEQSQNNALVWQARIAQQEASIVRLASSVTRAQRRLTETKLMAPFNAFVTQVGAQVGRIVSANDRVATLIDRDWIEVRFTLTDSQFGRIIAADKTLKGREVEILWRVGLQPLVYHAVIERVGAEVTADSGGIEVYARIEDPVSPVQIRPGAFVEVRVPDQRYRNVYRLPGTVLYDGDKVYAVIDGRLVGRKVKRVGTLGRDVLLSGAIKPGDDIITTRLSTPGDGLKVATQAQP